MKKIFVLLLILISINGFSQNHWVPNYHQFPTNMNVIAILEINGIEQRNDFLELGVFWEDECRGSCRLSYYDSPVDRYMFFLTTYGESGDPYTFKLYDHMTQQELDFTSSNEMEFHSNDIIGQVFTPYVFSFTGGNCSVTLSSEPSGAGDLDGGGDYLCGSFCTVRANPVDDYSFVAWMLNGDTLTTEESFSFNAVADVELMACFSEPVMPEVYEIQVSVDPEEGGVVIGGGSYEVGQSCTVSVILHEHYQFLNWTEDGEIVSTDESYSFVVNENRTLVAHLEFVNMVSDREEGFMLYPNPTAGMVRIEYSGEAFEQCPETMVYDVLGHCVLTSKECWLDFSHLQNGIYFVKIGEGRMHQVTLIR